MEIHLIAVHDKKAKVFQQVVSAPNKVTAIRSFEQECINNESPLHKYAKDFELVHLGTFDQESGEIKATKPTVLITAVDVVKQK